MRNNIKIWCLLTVIIFALPVHPQVPKDFYLKKNFDTGKSVASIDTLNITAEEFYLSYEFGPAFVKKEKDSRLKHLNYMINEKLLALDGYSRSIDTTDEVKSIIEEFRNDIATEELFKNEILPVIHVEESEVDKIIKQKEIEIELKWLFANDENGIKKTLQKLNKDKVPFDSLFTQQLNDSVNIDDRYMKTDRYQLENKNPALVKIIDSLKAGEVSIPVHVEDGWYIFKLNIIRNVITTQTEYEKLKQEANEAVVKREMDSLSDIYVKELMLKNNPVIKRDEFNIVRSYVGKYYLPDEKYKDWQLEEKLNMALKNVGSDIDRATLITLNASTISIKEFLSWYRNRSLYIKLDTTNVGNFSGSLENLVWRMVRDYLLSAVAKDKGYYNSAEVLKQASWWKDKIVGSAVRNEIAGSAVMENKELNTKNKNENKSDAEKLNNEFQAKVLHKILALKQKYKIKIDENDLNSVPVSTENEPRAIDLYIVKKGGLIPRTPYPTINHEWINWE